MCNHIVKESEKIISSKSLIQKGTHFRKRIIDFLAGVHMDFVAQLFAIVLVIMGTTVVYTNLNRESDSNTKLKDLFEINAVVATFCGLIITAANIHAQYHHDKMSKASRFVEMWYSPQMQERLDILRRIKEQEFDVKVRDRYCQNSSEECLIPAYILRESDPAFMFEIQSAVVERLKQNDLEKK